MKMLQPYTKGDRSNEKSGDIQKMLQVERSLKNLPWT